MLSKRQQQLHEQACKILEKDILEHEDCMFIFENWQESATNANRLAGAFFTPWGLARDLGLDIPRGPIVDLCAGIGVLSYFAYHHHEIREITCIELNPEYVAVGKKILPQATWICADIFEDGLPDGFRWAISNPPFGNVKTAKTSQFEFAAIRRAAQLAKGGTFILPQMSSPFEYSGKRCFTKKPKYPLDYEWTQGVGIDTNAYRDEWKGVNIITEVVSFDFSTSKNLF